MMFPLPSITRKAMAAFVAIAFLASCTDKKEKSASSLRASIGQPTEVLLILGDKVISSDLKDSLEAMLTCNVPGLNQAEDFFRVSRIPTSMHKEQFEKMHTKLIVKLDSKQKQPAIGTAYDVAARPQLQVLVSGPSVDALRPFLSSHADQIRQLLLENQLQLMTSTLRKHHSKKVAQALQKQFGYTALVPEEIKFTKTGKDFLWGSSRSTEKQLNVVFYSAPLASLPSEADLTSVLCALRDSVMQPNIPGSMPDQWMETTWEQGCPMALSRPLDINGQRVIEVRGLWQMRNGAMGGPFVQLCQIDTTAQRIFVSEGFVYSPSTNKRDLIRQLEAALRTVKRQ